MHPRFQVNVLGFTVLEEIEGSWTSQDFARLLDEMEFGDPAGMGPDELREMCVLSLQDKKPAAAAALLLEHRLGRDLGKGQIQNISHEMLDDKLWEDYADMPLHERLFHVGSLLYQAFPRSVPTPDAVEVVLEVTSEDPEGRRALQRPLHESFVVRLLADGMPETAALYRLFEDSLIKPPFPEAESIVWVAKSEWVDDRCARIQVIGSGRWLDSLRETEAYGSSAFADPPVSR